MESKVARIGVVGYCPPTNYNSSQAEEHLNTAFDQVERDFSGRKIVIVSGVTSVGVLKQAYELAEHRGFERGGVACEKAIRFDFASLTEEPVIVGKNWGDESQVFVSGVGVLSSGGYDRETEQRYKDHPHYGLDAMIRIGVGEQSMAETEQIRKQGKPTYEYDLPRLR